MKTAVSKTLRFIVAGLLCAFGVEGAFAATATMVATGAIAPHIVLNVTGNLNFGELVVTTYGSPGYLDLNAATGAGVPSNANQVGTPQRGSFTITGRANANVVLTIVPSGFACDTTYINPCTGTPSLTVTNTFSPTTVGQITPTNCTGIRCTDTIFVGGRFGFTGTEEGRWTNDLVITANYQ